MKKIQAAREQKQKDKEKDQQQTKQTPLSPTAKVLSPPAATAAPSRTSTAAPNYLPMPAHTTSTHIVPAVTRATAGGVPDYAAAVMAPSMYLNWHSVGCKLLFPCMCCALVCAATGAAAATAS